MAAESNNSDAYLSTLIKHKAHSSQYCLNYLVKNFFGKIKVENGHSVLDIGSGMGKLGFYAASQGASEVICLEPEASGSCPGVNKKFDELKNALPFGDKVQLLSKTFQDFEKEDNYFDLIICFSAINHLDEPACMDLKENPDSNQKYRRYFRKMYSMMKTNGRIIIADCSRYNFFGLLKITNPLMPDVEWKKHQSPYQWRKLLIDAGFREPKINWVPLNSMGPLGPALMGNPVINFLTTSYFKLSALKAD